MSRRTWIAVFTLSGVVGAVAAWSATGGSILNIMGGFLVGVVLAGIAAITF